MRFLSAGKACSEALKNTNSNFTKEDINVIGMFSKMLGQTDIEGQISQIEITEQFLEKQIKEAR